jgi:hypothetical protein
MLSLSEKCTFILTERRMHFLHYTAKFHLFNAISSGVFKAMAAAAAQDENGAMSGMDGNVLERVKASHSA